MAAQTCEESVPELSLIHIFHISKTKNRISQYYTIPIQLTNLFITKMCCYPLSDEPQRVELALKEITSISQAERQLIK